MVISNRIASKSYRLSRLSEHRAIHDLAHVVTAAALDPQRDARLATDVTLRSEAIPLRRVIRALSQAPSPDDQLLAALE